jgi:SWI/SNF-related matrix-associated actin-dependent regulator of chromatin subfamily A3
MRKQLTSSNCCLPYQHAVSKLYINAEARAPFLKGSTKNGNALTQVDVVVYGQKSIRLDVGQILSSARMYLQHPYHQDPNTYYDNPHVLRTTDITTRSHPAVKFLPVLDMVSDDSDIEVVPSHDSTSQHDLPANERFQRRVAGVFNSLTRFKSLKRLEADIKITTPLRQ